MTKRQKEIARKRDGKTEKRSFCGYFDFTVFTEACIRKKSSGT